MYEAFYGLKEKPFTLLPDPDYLYLSPKHQRALTLLEYGMMNQAGFSVICGDTGAGKTTLIRRLLSELGDDTTVGLITNTHQSFGELLNWVLMAFGLDGDGKSKAQMHQMFINFLVEQYADKKHTVLIVDEAQNMKADTLEELRMLSNINADKDQVLQVILAGQPALRETLRKPELMQFAQRIAVDYYLEALSMEETCAYINHRLHVAGAEAEIFTAEACQAIYRYSGGTPRLINLLCDTALVYGFAEQSKSINAQLVHDVVEEQHSNSIIPTFNIESEQAELEVSSGVVSEPQNIVSQEDDSLARLTERAVSAVNAADAIMPVKNSEVIQKAQQINDELEKAAQSQKESAVLPDATVTPINKQSQKDSPTPEKEFESIEVESAVKDSEQNAEVSKSQTASQAEGAGNKVEEVDVEVPGESPAASVSSASAHKGESQPEQEVYPIVHVEENPKKAFSLLLVGLVGGMFVASIAMVIIAWMLFSTNDVKLTSSVNSTSQSVDVDATRELKILQQERDAALAVSRALERERDAALTAAKAQEEMRAAEMRAAEILAAQEREAEARLREARARALAAERAEQKAIERERLLRLRAEQRAAELAAQKAQLLKQQQLEAQQLEAQQLAQQQKESATTTTASTSQVVVQPPAQQPAQQVEGALSQPAVQPAQVVKITQAPVVETVQPTVKTQNLADGEAETKAKEIFTANPCNSASAKFLSTCKR